MRVQTLLVSLSIVFFTVYSCSPIEKPYLPEEKPETPESPETPSDPGNSDDSDDNAFPYAESDVILYDNFDKTGDFSSSNQYVDQCWQTYSNAVGWGASGIDYSKSSYSSFHNKFQSIGYPGASGNNTVSLYNNTSVLDVQKIRIPLDKRVYKLAFGLNSYVNGSNDVKEGETVHIFVTDGTAEAVEIPWKAKQYEKWYYVTSDFAVAGNVQYLNVSIK